VIFIILWEILRKCTCFRCPERSERCGHISTSRTSRSTIHRTTSTKDSHSERTAAWASHLLALPVVRRTSATVLRALSCATG